MLQNPPQTVDRRADQDERAARCADAGAVLFRSRRDAEAVLQREEALKQRLEPLIEKKIISGYHAMSNWVPSLRSTRNAAPTDRKRLLSHDGALAVLAARIGADGHGLTATRDRLLASAEKLTPDEFLKASASRAVRHLWLGQVGRRLCQHRRIARRERGRLAIVVASGGAARRRAVGGQGRRNFFRAGSISSIDGLGSYCFLILRFTDCFIRAIAARHGGSWPHGAGQRRDAGNVGYSGKGMQLFHVLALMLLLGVGVDYGIFFKSKPG